MITHLDEIVAQFPFRTISSFKKWCKKNGVVVIDHDDIPFVYTSEFEVAFNRPYLERLKLKYPNNWQPLFESILKNEYSKIVQYTENQVPTVNHIGYQPSIITEAIKKDLIKKVKNDKI